MSDEDDELYTEVEDEDNYEPEQKEFSIYRPLEPPSMTQWSVADLHFLMHQGSIDLEAPYQRDIVWPDNKKVQLIDSIFRNFYIPPVIFAMHVDDDGNEIRVCVDGKQRLTSISRFMDGVQHTNGEYIITNDYKGQIPHRDTKTKRAYWFTRGNSKTSRSLLPESFRKKFKNKQLTCIEYTNLTPSDERDLFQRVQLGMSLTPAEKLQAVQTDITDWIRTLQQKFTAAENGLQQNLKWNTARGKDFSGLAQLCFCCWHVPQYVFPSNAKLDKWFRTPTLPSQAFAKQMQAVLESYVYLSMKEEYQQGFSKIKERVAPIEFVMIGVLLAKMRNCSWEDRAEQILAMRKHVRSQHKDIRGNERVMKTMWIFVEEISVKGATFDDWEGPEECSKKPTTARKTTQARKRAREDAEIPASKPGPSKKPSKATNVESKVGGANTPASKPEKSNGVRFVA